MIIYALLGVATEVCFTACKNLYYNNDWNLEGHTQLWVIPLYAIGGCLFEYVRFNVPSIYLRIPTYLVLLYMIEYGAGLALFYWLGKCPWEYEEWGNVHGLIQLTYIPFWTVFVLGADFIIPTFRICKSRKFFCSAFF